MTMYQYRLHIERYLYVSTKAMEHTRLIAYQIYCTVATNKISIEQYMSLSSDKKEPEKEVSKERLIQMQEEAKRRYEIMQKLEEK